jgi:hypothetical protein
MEAELTDRLGYEPHLEPPGGAGNARNGSTPKTLITEQGAVYSVVFGLHGPEDPRRWQRAGTRVLSGVGDRDRRRARSARHVVSGPTRAPSYDASPHRPQAASRTA